MGTKRENLINPNSCFSRAENDEPIFVLRAHDPLAADTVRRWAQARRLVRGAWDEKAAEAFLVADRMEEWRKVHHG